jgi:hypothetical protein
MTTLGLGLVAGMLLWVAPPAHAQQQDDRVLLSIEVTDNKARYINGLQSKDFRILEDGIVQKIDTFAENENSYNVTYLPAQNANEGFRKIEVQVISDVGQYRVRHKVGYTPRRPIAKNSK